MPLSLEFSPPLTLAFAAHAPRAPRAPRRFAANGCRTRALAYVGAPRCDDRLAGRAAARLAIARASGVEDAGRIVLRARREMPPAAFLADARGVLQELPISLSVAHCAGRAVAVAAPRSARIGVDLERSGSVLREQRRYFLTPAECRAGEVCPPTTLWVLKEAAWKALGCRGRMPFSAVVLCFDPRGLVTAVRNDSRRIGVRAWLLRPWPGFICAVMAVEDPK